MLLFGRTSDFIRLVFDDCFWEICFIFCLICCGVFFVFFLGCRSEIVLLGLIIIDRWRLGKMDMNLNKENNDL